MKKGLNAFTKSIKQHHCTQANNGQNLVLSLTHYQTNKFQTGLKSKQSADDNFKFDENSKKFSKRVENTVGKGEIAR